MTVIMLAIEKKHVDIAKAILETQKVELNAKGKNGMTALMFAAKQHGYIDIINALI